MDYILRVSLGDKYSYLRMTDVGQSKNDTFKYLDKVWEKVRGWIISSKKRNSNKINGTGNSGVLDGMLQATQGILRGCDINYILVLVGE